ncbi:hypothetical protein PUV44_08105 [Xanthomonas arboricola pv. corylina]|nr:hypothetical protein PUV44_08105 [Xanthomonas arboricola pv. corylina]
MRQLLDGEAAHFAQLTTSRQLLYSSLDLMLQACQIPDSAEDVTVDATADEDRAFRLLRLNLGQCQASLRLQTYLDPQDPDLHSLVMHQLTLGWPSGYLSLEASHGPVLWTAALYDPHHHDSDRSLYQRAHDQDEDPYARPATQVLHAAPPDWRHSVEIDGPTGVGRVLQLLGQHLDGAALPPAFDAAYQLALASLWQQVLRCAGPAHARSLPAPRLLDLREPAAPGHAEPIAAR